MAIIKREQIYDNQSGDLHMDRSRVIPFNLFNEDKGYMLFLNKRNVRIFPDIDFPSECGISDIARLFLLSRQIVSTTNMIGRRVGGSIRPLSVEGMADIADMPPRRFTTWINRMVKLGMIGKVKITTEDTETIQYYLNPLYFFSDKYLPLNLYLLFQTQIDRHLPAWAKQKYREMQIEP